MGREGACLQSGDPWVPAEPIFIQISGSQRAKDHFENGHAIFFLAINFA